VTDGGQVGSGIFGQSPIWEINAMLFRRILLVPLALVLQVAVAHAESAVRTIGGTNFDLPAPTGFCMADAANAVDARFITVVGGFLQSAQNKLILAAVECGRLKRLREGDASNILNYALYYVPFSAENLTLPGDAQSTRKALCQEMRKQGNINLDGVKDVVAQKAKEMGANIGVNSTQYIGVVDEDVHGCYAALLVGLKDESGRNIIMSSVVTTTVVHSKPVFFAVYSEYTGPEATLTSVQTAKATAAELDAKNP
jgi:hypothetical protein